MRLGKDISTIYNDELEAYDKLVNAEYQKHYKIKQGDDIFSNGRVHVNGIENFWGIAKMRMVEMREVAGD